MDDFVNFDDNYGFINEPVQISARKVYKRNKSDPLDVYSNYEFFRRFRFTKEIFSNILMPMIFPEDDQNVNLDIRGLPITNSWKLLTALRFYGTGCYQIILLNTI
jgi:nuclease HARBI1